jgi:hypothetical protein
MKMNDDLRIEIKFAVLYAINIYFFDCFFHSHQSQSSFPPPSIYPICSFINLLFFDGLFNKFATFKYLF